ncbi:MAG: HEPN domain-containing protein [bacterium]
MNLELQHVSHAFRTDSGHLVEKARAAYKHGRVRMRTGFQAKIVVDLFMAIECALKSMMCTNAPSQDVETVLSAIFKYGHDLKRLLKAGKPKSLQSEEIELLNELNNKGVSLRYDLDLYSIVSSDLLCSDDVIFKIDPEYVERLMELAKRVSDEAQSAHKNAFSEPSRLLSRKQLEHEVRYLRSLLTRVRSKNCRRS